MIVAFGNAVNLTDGLDGLATMPVIIASVAFMLIAYLAGNANFADLSRHSARAAARAIWRSSAAAIIGAGLAFLWFNAPPAAVFMGDTGSLALGGALGAIAVAAHHEIVLGIVGGLFVVEALSRHHPGVLLQAHRQARLPDGADPPSFRAARLERVDRRDPLLDHLVRARAGRPVDAEAAVIVSPALARQALRGARAGALGRWRRSRRCWRAAREVRRLGQPDEEARARALARTGVDDFGRSAGRSTSTGFDGVVVSPGVPLNRHPIAAQARARRACR